MPLVLIILAATSNTSLAQGTLNLLGTGTPAVVDSGDARPVVLAVTVVSDVAGQVLGCSFYVAGQYRRPRGKPVGLTGKILASQAATGETASGKQTVMFSTPVAIAAKQTFVCGYYAPNGHWSFTGFVFTTPVRRCAFAHSGQRELVPLWHIGSAITNLWLPAQLLG